MIATRLRATGVLALASTLGCAAVQPTIATAPDPVAIYGARAHRTAFEDPTVSTTPSAAPAVASGPQPADSGVDTDEPTKDQRTRTGLFWGGVGAMALGGAMLGAFGIGGRVTQAQLQKGYDEGTLTYDREDKLRGRGSAFNKLAGAGAGIAVVGLAMAVIVYGLDYSRCGTLAKRRKDCHRKSP
jgi:hypothetical protein